MSSGALWSKLVSPEQKTLNVGAAVAMRPSEAEVRVCFNFSWWKRAQLSGPSSPRPSGKIMRKIKAAR